LKFITGGYKAQSQISIQSNAALFFGIVY